MWITYLCISYTHNTKVISESETQHAYYSHIKLSCRVGAPMCTGLGRSSYDQTLNPRTWAQGLTLMRFSKLNSCQGCHPWAMPLKVWWPLENTIWQSHLTSNFRMPCVAGHMRDLPSPYASRGIDKHLTLWPTHTTFPNSKVRANFKDLQEAIWIGWDLFERKFYNEIGLSL